MKSQEDEFYGELDAKKLRRSCCTTQTMLIFFVGLLIIALIGTIYIYKKIKEINISSKIIASTFQDKQSFINKIKPDKLENNIEIPITSEELTAILAEGLSSKNFVIKNIQVVIQPAGIDIYGSLVKPIGSQIKIETVPEAVAGKIKFRVQKITIGSLAIPKAFNAQVENVIESSMDQNFNQLYNNYTIQNVSLADDKMIISVNGFL